MPDDISVDTSKFERKIALAINQPSVLAEIRVQGRARDYWFVPEYGSKRGQRPWPNPRKRTVARGSRVFSSQAPRGYVFRFKSHAISLLRRGFKRAAQVKHAFPDHMALAASANQAATGFYQAIRSSVPIGNRKTSGELLASITLKKAE